MNSSFQLGLYYKRRTCEALREGSHCTIPSYISFLPSEMLAASLISFSSTNLPTSFVFPPGSLYPLLYPLFSILPPNGSFHFLTFSAPPPSSFTLQSSSFTFFSLSLSLLEKRQRFQSGRQWQAYSLELEHVYSMRKNSDQFHFQANGITV